MLLPVECFLVSLIRLKKNNKKKVQNDGLTQEVVLVLQSEFISKSNILFVDVNEAKSTVLETSQ